MCTHVEDVHVHMHRYKLPDKDTYIIMYTVYCICIKCTCTSSYLKKRVWFIGLRLPDKFHSTEQSPPVPVLVVTMATGGELQRLLREHPREMEVKIDHQLSHGELVERDGEYIHRHRTEHTYIVYTYMYVPYLSVIKVKCISS